MNGQPLCSSGSCVLSDLLPELLEFLGQDLEHEQLTEVGRERQRCLLRQVSLLRIAQCGLPAQAAEMRRSQPPPPLPPHRQQQQQQQSNAGLGGFLSDALFTRRSQLTGSGRSRDPQNRMSLPPQAFSNLGFTFDKHEAAQDDSVYEKPISQKYEDTILLPGKRSSLAAAAAPNQHQQHQHQHQVQAPSMSGALRHRNEDTCRWQRYPACQLMSAGSRLICYKSSRTSGSPSLTFLLAGYTALYVERESSASHVIKLTHPSLPTHALAADSEDEARAWVARINCQQQQHQELLNVPLFGMGGFEQELDSGFSGPVSSSSTDSYEQQAPPPQQQQQRQPKLTKSATFTPGFGQHPPMGDGAAAIVHARQHSGGSGSSSGGFMRRFRDSFGAGGSNRRRHRREAAAAAAAATAAAAAAAAAAQDEGDSSADCLVESDAEVRLGGRGPWYRCQARLRRGGRLCLPGVTAEPILLDDRTRLLPIGDETANEAGGTFGSSGSEVIVGGHVVRRRRNRGGGERVCGIRLVTDSHVAGSSATVIAELRNLDKLALGEWIKHLALATGMAPQYEPLSAELLDLNSARALVDSRRRASMPEPQLDRLTDLVASAAAASSSRAPRPLPPLPDTSITSIAGSPCEQQPPYSLYDLATADRQDLQDNSADNGGGRHLVGTDRLEGAGSLD